MHGPQDDEEGLGPTQAPTERSEGLHPGLILGRRYRLIERLGQGGMGEVWLAFDQKLCLDVALKFLRHNLVTSERALEQLRAEVRSARQVVSPAVCRIHDLVEADGRELVSMEYIEGQTLTELLRERSPLEICEVAELAGQFLSGLEAIHTAGLVHRDIKPENIMISRAGRVVIMDFGVARAEHDGQHTISGTPAYMAPEHARGESLDARADIYAAGVVLAEMVHPNGVHELESRRAVWEAVHHEPPQIPESPWRPILRKAVAPDPAQRYADARALMRAIERLQLRAQEGDEAHPYPGLSPYSTENARFFFGREIEIESTWRKISQGHLMALVGPSGAGKSSFVRAGLLPTMPEGWRSVAMAPGDRPFKALAAAMLPEFEGHEESLRRLLDLEDLDSAVRLFSNWRRRHDEVLLILDQFEELFTLNPPEVQAAFAALLGCIALEADVRVLFSMRDDFLMRCHEHPDLTPIFSDLTPLQAPHGAALRRALEQPALQCGYHFEDEVLVEEMLEEVEGERGALPLLAFAVASLWERRDREHQLLTRQAYEEIGGVGGALARHAESTMDAIGSERTPIVREIFRNLVTAEGTRAARDRDELLSVFEDPRDAGGVLRHLVDARLLTSFEQEDGERTRIEIVHESLLRAWPRLVRWQTQDAEGALLREQLRQAANIWEERGRPGDLLWSGTAYQEYVLWQERYVGGLTAIEKDFAQAMTARAERARQRRRLAVGGAFVALLVILTVVGSLWRHSAEQARIAKSNELVALGQGWLETFHTNALAYAIASLEIRDNEAARRLAIEADWKGPLRNRLPPLEGSAWAVAFSPDGEWLAVGDERGQLSLFPADGGPPKKRKGHEFILQAARFHPTQPWLVTSSQRAGAKQGPSIHVWSIPELDSLFHWDAPEVTGAFWAPEANSLLTVTGDPGTLLHGWREWQLPDWSERPFEAPYHLQYTLIPDLVDPTGERQVVRMGDGYSVRELPVGGGEDRELFFFERAGDTGEVKWTADGRRFLLITWAPGFPVHLIDLEGAEGPSVRTIGSHLGAWMGDFTSSGRDLVTGSDAGTFRLWDLEGPPDSSGPTVLAGYVQVNGITFSPGDDWLMLTGGRSLMAYPMAHRYPLELRVDEGELKQIEVDPHGQWVATLAHGGDIRLWPLSPDAIVPRAEFRFADAQDFGIDASGRSLVVCGVGGIDHLDLETGDQSRDLDCGEDATVKVRRAGAIDRQRKRLASVGGFGESFLRICITDLASGATAELDSLEEDEGVRRLHFLPDGRLLVGTTQRLLRWDLETEEFETLIEGSSPLVQVDAEGRRVYVGGRGGIQILDLQSGETLRPPFLEGLFYGTISPDGEWLASFENRSGEIRVCRYGETNGYLYLRHEGGIYDLAFDPLGRWIISAGADGRLMFWPMPEGEPRHDLPYDKFLARFKALTNERVVDGEEPGSYRIDHEPFAGWDRTPRW